MGGRGVCVPLPRPDGTGNRLRAEVRHALADLAPWTQPAWRHLRREVTPDNAGERCYLRLERQTLSVLPGTGTVLFTIHTYRAPVAREVEDPARRRLLAGVLRTLPPETSDYKGVSLFLPSLISWLDAAS